MIDTVFFAIQKLADQLLAFVRLFAGQKCPCFVCSGQGSNGVQKDSAQKRRVIRKFRRLDSELLKFVPDELVNKVVYRRTFEVSVRSRNSNVTDSHLFQKPNQHRRFTGQAFCLNASIVTDRCHALGVGLKLRGVGDVALSTIRKESDRSQLAASIQSQNSVRWLHFDRSHGQGFCVERRALGQPAQNRALVLGICPRSTSAAVRNPTGGLAKNQARFRHHAVDSAPTVLFRECFEIGVRIKAKDAQPEAVLPFRFAMTSAGIAAQLCECRNDFRRE